MTTADSVLLPAPFGPITAWTSPRRHREVDAAEDLLAADGGAQAADLAACVIAHLRPRRDRSTVAVVDRRRVNTGTGWVAGSVDRLAGLEAERAAVLRALDLPLVAPHLALATATRWRGCRRRRSRRRRRRCARRRRRCRRHRPGARCPAASSASGDTSPRPSRHLRRARARGRAWPTTRRAQLGGERADGQLVEHLVEEAEHDQPLGDLGRDAAALEVEALLRVDRADRRGVAALARRWSRSRGWARSRPTRPR